MIASSANVMPRAPYRGCVPGAAAFRPSPTSRCAAVAPRRGAPPNAPAAPGPESRESPTPAAIRNGAVVPTATATGGGAASGRRRGSVHRAAAVRPPIVRRSASRAAPSVGSSTAGAMPSDALPVDAFAAPSPLPQGCPVAAGASPWRSSASRPNERAPAARSGTPDGAPSGGVWIAESIRTARRAVLAARSAPMSARQSVTSCHSGRRRSPWSTSRPAPNSVPSRPKPRPSPASSSQASGPPRSSSAPTRPSWRSQRRRRHGRGPPAGTARLLARRTTGTAHPPCLHASSRGTTNV